MNESTARAIERLTRKLERAQKRPRSRAGSAPIVLGAGLAVGILLLGWLLPRLWATLLPGGLNQASRFQGAPGLLYQLAVACYRFAPALMLVACVVTVVSWVVARAAMPLRLLVWLLAVVVVAIDAGILVVGMRAAMTANAAASGLPF